MTSPGLSEVGDRDMAVMLDAVGGVIRRLRELGRVEGKGKSPERVERKDEAWECMTRLGEMLKKSDTLRPNVNVDDVLSV
jgi:hypothetical protein